MYNTQTRPETRTFWSNPTRTRPEVKKPYSSGPVYNESKHRTFTKIAFSPKSKSVLTLRADPLKWLLTNSLWSWGEVNNILRCFSLSVMLTTESLRVNNYSIFSDYDEMSTWKVNIFHADMYVGKSKFWDSFWADPSYFPLFSSYDNVVKSKFYNCRAGSTHFSFFF